MDPVDPSSAPGGLPGPPPLAPFGLRLQHDGRFTHEGVGIANRRLRAHFDRSVEYLPRERKYIVRLKHFRGEIEVEEAAFFVRSLDLATGEMRISDGSQEKLEVSTLTVSPIDGALLCLIKRDQSVGGLPARFSHSVHAEFGQAVEQVDSEFVVSIGGQRKSCPEF
ncbi:MAG: hypothetical protein VCB25_01065 [Myxococcota bacterium]